MNGEHPNTPAPLTTDPVSHTPGPWMVNKYCNVGAGQYGTLPIVAYVEPLEGSDRKYGNHHANARLIAAAPDLLEALKDLLGRSEAEGWAYSAEERETAKQAIAKAEGLS